MQAVTHQVAAAMERIRSERELRDAAAKLAWQRTLDFFAKYLK